MVCRLSHVCIQSQQVLVANCFLSEKFVKIVIIWDNFEENQQTENQFQDYHLICLEYIKITKVRNKALKFKILYLFKGKEEKLPKETH